MAQCLEIPSGLQRLFDILIGCLFIAPLVICFWRSTWLLMDIFIFPDSHLNSALVSLATGLVFCEFVLLTQGWIVRKLSDSHRRRYLLLTWKIFIYLTSISCVSFWRGVWMLMDKITGVSIPSYVLSHVISLVILTTTRTTCSIVCPPGCIVNDQKVGPFNLPLTSLPTIRCVNKLSDSIKFVLSSLLTVCVIGSAVVCYWRGTWNLCIYIAEVSVGSGLNSCITMGSLGYTICLVCFVISEPLEKKLTCSSLQWPYLIKAVIEHVFIYVLGFGSVSVWSGVWCLADYYLFIGTGKETKLTALLVHVITVIVLYLGQSAVNLVGTPAGCKTHSRNTLLGLFMGTYFTGTEPKVIGRKAGPKNNATQAETSVTGHENNAISTEPDTTGNAISTIHTGPDVADIENQELQKSQ